MKPFSLDEHIKNPTKRVITRDGRSARIICADFNNKNYPVIVEVEGMEGPVSVTREGRHMSSSIDNNLDIFFDSKKHEGWMNVYKFSMPSGDYKGSFIWPTEEEAKSAADSDPVATVKIEWEE